MQRFSHNRLFFVSAGVLALTLFVTEMLAVSARDQHMPVEHVTIDSFSSEQPSPGVSVQSKTASRTDVLIIPDGQDEITYVTETYAPEFAFNAIGVQWHGETTEHDVQQTNPESVSFDVYIRDSSGTTQHRILPPLSHDMKQPSAEGVHVTQPVIVQDVAEFWATITLRRDAEGKSPRVDDIDFTYLDSTRPSSNDLQPFKGIATAEAAGENVANPLGILSREEWGADESLRKNEDGEIIWPLKYADPKVFIVHHTAGTDGGDDPAATVRAVYYWHAAVLGWGDIGYNYIIDPAGNIYHGRKGGDGVIGGHTLNTEDDVDFNPGSVGIVLLGCFEETPGVCYNEYTITDEMEKSLARLIGVQSAVFGFEPESETTFHGRDVARVVGHRDLDYTFCPGSALEANIPSVRVRAQQRYVKETTEPYEAEFDGESTLSLNPQQPASVTMTYTNTGMRTWKKKQLRLKIYSASGKKPTSLRATSWPDVLGKILMEESTVAPGEQATFVFPLRIKNETEPKTLMLKLFSGATKVKESNATITVTFTDSTMPEDEPSEETSNAPSPETL